MRSFPVPPWIPFGKPHMEYLFSDGTSPKGSWPSYLEQCEEHDANPELVTHLEVVPGMELLMASGERRLVGSETAEVDTLSILGREEIITHYRVLVPWPTTDLPGQIETEF